MDISIIVGTFGDPEWDMMGQNTAQSLADKFPTITVYHEHCDTLAEARNTGADNASSEWLCFVDADDDLDKDYFEIMQHGSGDLLVPQLFEGHNGQWEEVVLTDRHMENMNACPVGTLIRKSMLIDCGWWPDFRAWEDYALFLRAYRRGAIIEHMYGAKYLAGYNASSRNRTIFNAGQLLDEIRNWA